MTPRARRIALATAIGLIYVLTGKIGLAELLADMS